MRRGAGAVDLRAAGLTLALVSAAAFGTAGPLAKGLITAGWSAPAVAFARLAGTAVLLTVLLAVVLGLLSGAAEHRDHVLGPDERDTAFMPCVSRAPGGCLTLDL